MKLSFLPHLLCSPILRIGSTALSSVNPTFFSPDRRWVTCKADTHHERTIHDTHMEMGWNGCKWMHFWLRTLHHMFVESNPKIDFLEASRLRSTPGSILGHLGLPRQQIQIHLLHLLHLLHPLHQRHQRRWGHLRFFQISEQRITNQITNLHTNRIIESQKHLAFRRHVEKLGQSCDSLVSWAGTKRAGRKIGQWLYIVYCTTITILLQ